jgi:hypothetical protein
MSRAPRLLIVTAVAGWFAGCGAPGPSSGCVVAACGLPPSPGVTVPASAPAGGTAHGWNAEATIDSAHRTIDIKLSVTGPLAVDGGCLPSLTAWAIADDGRRIDPGPSPGLRCNAISVQQVPEGMGADFQTSIPLPPPGTYMVHGLLRTHLPAGAGTRVIENLPVVTITVP